MSRFGGSFIFISHMGNWYDGVFCLQLGAENVLRWSGGDGLASSTGVDGSGMMHQAEMYLRVRALSAPAALIGTVAVGAYRGLLDTKTPLLVSGANQRRRRG